MEGRLPRKHPPPTPPLPTLLTGEHRWRTPPRPTACWRAPPLPTTRRLGLPYPCYKPSRRRPGRMEDLAQVDYSLARKAWEARHIFLVLP
jgi:hypothetical protein